MAKKSSIEKNNRRRRMAKKFSNRRKSLKAIARDKKLPMEERFAATLKLAELEKTEADLEIKRQDLAGRTRFAAGAAARSPKDFDVAVESDTTARGHLTLTTVFTGLDQAPATSPEEAPRAVRVRVTQS